MIFRRKTCFETRFPPTAFSRWSPAIAAALLLWAAGFNAAYAAPRVAILLSDQNRIYNQIAQGLRDEMHASVREISLSPSPDLALDALREFDPVLVVAVGDTAALWAQDFLKDLPVVVAGVIQQSNPQVFQKMPGVSLDFSPETYLTLIREGMPSARRVGLLYNPARQSKFVKDLKAAAESMGIEVNAQPVQKEKSMARALETLKNWGTQMFLLTYDPLLMNPESWLYLSGFSITNRIALTVPSVALLKKGGTISLEANYVVLGRQAAAIANALLEAAGPIPRLVQRPAKAEIGVNLKIAGVLEISIPASFQKKAEFIHE